MIKPPSLRLSCIADAAPEVLDKIEADCRWAVEPLPFPIHAFEVLGSAARQAWQFHSDLDLNLVTQLSREETLKLWQGNKPQAQEVMRRFRSLFQKWEFRFLFRFEYPLGAKLVPYKASYDLVERVHYHPEATQRVDELPDGTVTPRIERPPMRPLRFTCSWFDEDGNQHINEDPYSSEEVERWAARYGEKFQRLGETEETAYMKR